MEQHIEQLAPLYRYIRESLGRYLLGGLLLAATSGCALMIPWLLKLAIESIQKPEGAALPPSRYGMAIIAAALLHGIIRIFSRTTLLHNARQIEFRLRDELYEKLLHLDLAFYSKERTGDLISRFSNDLTNVRMLLGFGILNLINTVIIYSTALIFMVKINPLLTLFATTPFPVMILVVKRLSAAMFKRSKRSQEELADLTSTVEENISAAAVVKAYCREEDSVSRFAEVSSRYMESNMKIARLRGLMIPVMAATGALGTLITLLVGGGKVVSGSISLGDFVAFSGYLTMLIWPTIIMGWILNLIQRGAASMSRINEILQAESRIKDPEHPLHPIAVKGEIEIKNLGFCFGSRQILRDLSLSIPAGSKLGIVGPVGSGKSTLARILARLYPVQGNTVFIDGNDINRLPLEILRGAIGYVPQESFLFSRSIADNIAFGQNNPAQGSVQEVSRTTRLDKDLSGFPEGYNSMVGERGITLSGGQKQRASIARALIRNPAILILDDPLSAVDAATEEEILKNLSDCYGNKTVIIISHRLSALRDCDNIIYLDDGSVIEQGTHHELLTRGGRYAALHREQELRAEIGEI